MEGLGGALHTRVAGIDGEPSVLKHKYHRHLNHEGPEGGFGGSRQLSLFLGGSSQGALSTPPPPHSNCKPGYPCIFTCAIMEYGGTPSEVHEQSNEEGVGAT